MARPALGGSAKTAIASTRVTRKEKEWLEARYGSMSRGMRALLNAAKAAEKGTDDAR